MQIDSDSIIVWNVIMWYSLGLQVCLKTSLIGNHYFTLIYDHLHSFMAFTHPNKDRLIQGNNESSHWDQIDQKYFEEHFGVVTTLTKSSIYGLL